MQKVYSIQLIFNFPREILLIIFKYKNMKLLNASIQQGFWIKRRFI